MMLVDHNPSNRRDQMEFASIDMLVPQHHLLRLIDQYVDFSCITEKTRPYYKETPGRPPIHPIRLFKMMLIGYLYGIRSERQLEQEISTNVAYRWFLGLGLTDRVPDHSTISYNRNTRFQGTNLFQEIFDEIVVLAIHHKMVAGRVLMTDSTHIQANASKNRYTIQEVEGTPQAYLKELEMAINKEREEHGTKPLAPATEEPSKKKQKVSVTDPQSGYMTRTGKPEGFCYLDHRTVDHKFNIITDVHVTPGNVNDSVVYIERLKRQIETFGFDALEAIALDSGYMTPYLCKTTLDLHLYPAIVERKVPTTEGTLPKSAFSYDSAQDQYVCPEGKILTYTTTNRAGYKEYKSDPATCSQCPLQDQCTSKSNKQRVIQRHIWEEAKEQVVQNDNSDTGKRLLRWRRSTIERSFADAKTLHGYRRCKFRGKAKTQEQSFMTAMAQNIKKIARYLAQKEGIGHGGNARAIISLGFPPISSKYRLNSVA